MFGGVAQTETSSYQLLLVQLESRTSEASRLLARLESRASEVSRLRAQLENRTSEVDALRQRLHQELEARARLELVLRELEAEVGELRLDVQSPDRGRHGLLRRGDKRRARPPVATLMTPSGVPPVPEPAAESIDEVLNRRL